MVRPDRPGVRPDRSGQGSGLSGRPDRPAGLRQPWILVHAVALSLRTLSVDHFGQHSQYMYMCIHVYLTGIL